MQRTSADIITDPVGRYPAATVACFDPTRGGLPRRSLDEARTIAMLERLAGEGAEGLLIASSTGQGHLRTVGELEIWLRCAANADTGEAVRMMQLRPEDGIRANERLMDLTVEAGFPVVLLRPGMNLSPDADEIQVTEQLQPLVAAAAERGLAVGLYSISDVSGLPLSADTAARLVGGAGGKHVVAVKVTEADYDSSTARYLAHPELQHLKIVQGWDPHAARALADGPRFDSRGRKRVGITSGLMALGLFQFFHLLEADERGDWEEVERALAAAITLFRAMQDAPGRFADLQRAKYIMGLGHPLTGRVDDAQAERLFAALEGLPRASDRRRLARSLDLMGDGPFHQRLSVLADR